VDTYERAIPA